ncbi:ABC transporter ATP-binding protein [Virgibacillus pantothenticus]|uniref:Iron-enterobactin transporter ATP-binding protein n=1 Tax=Virgibacillus pantothenticus TaxID=1473 RepID=A0A0L0QVN8_VIRPA|nr:ABC transporter ATP-binding protein [Virgibacillus pantothenticus]KNE22626.1 iron-enterobactin transporter ATP-binding protein [Virgibacillus pantothenticus]MBU8567019.1 ABC transporter ATP-binding protein [Virgibacillus pantothenticus]MBU8601943.1 ABC transporter ATP-binding protein [Virgibacillus pantothenticus]MBU8635046.1 ABC transporter ATP-binding protein [Virgibacillus pantothenticus]MBU8642875.1 ABC transporter ATP-binding protein [Virgibacillus pantothenticus]
MYRLTTNDLSVGYGKEPIVRNLSVEIPDSKITSIIGSNGCGKSTLLKAITRIIPYEEGSVLLDGSKIATMKTKDVAKKMAILPQTPDSASGLTVGELVSYGRFPHQNGLGRLKKADIDMIHWAMEVTAVLEFKHRTVDELSGGQRQRVWIAMALAQETDIILLDEPTTYLDMAHQLDVLQLLEQLNKEEGRTIVMVLHDINQAARFSDYLLAMRSGKIIQAGSPHEVLTKDMLRNVYEIDGEIATDPRTGKPMCITYDLIKQKEKQSYEKTIHSAI